MTEEDMYDIELFQYFNKLPDNEQIECEVFITPEKIFGIQEAEYLAVDELNGKFNYLKMLPRKEMEELIEDGSWRYYHTFKKIVAAIKEYVQLRPAILDKYPEFLI